MKMLQRSLGLLLLCAIVGLSLGVVGCEGTQNTGTPTRTASGQPRFPQTKKSIVIDPQHAPSPNAKVVSVYDDSLYGKTELRDDDYHRHVDSESPTGWTPWHYRHYPHVWADEPAPAPTAPMAAGHTAMYFPSATRDGDGKPCCAQVRLDKYAPVEVAVGQVFEYKLVATNDSSLTLRDVIVTDKLPANFKVDSATPAGNGQGTWNLGELAPGASATITIKGAATEPGSIVNCATVSFVPYICIATNVVKPALQLSKTAPDEVLLCQSIPVTFTVTNTGSGTARNVKINDDLPKGLVTDAGDGHISIPVGDLAGGESRKYTASLKATSTGKYVNHATAAADGGLTAEASTTTSVHQPVLTIKKTGPEKVILGRSASYDITVTNTGDTVAKNTVIDDTITSGAFVSATDGGSAVGDKVSWNIGDLAVNGSKTVSVTVRNNGIGVIGDTATARAVFAAPVTAEARTQVVGIAAILLEMVDDHDPIEIGHTVTYTITLTNQGTAPDSDLKVVCNLENTMQFVSCEGATPGTSDGKVVTFAPLATLAAKDKAVWHVVVRAVGEGDVRFKVTINTAQLQRPVEKTESTNFYK